MNAFVIIETDNGLTVVEVRPGERPEDVALRHQGTLIDEEIYHTYEDACDAMSELAADEPEA